MGKIHVRSAWSLGLIFSLVTPISTNYLNCVVGSSHFLQRSSNLYVFRLSKCRKGLVLASFAIFCWWYHQLNIVIYWHLLKFMWSTLYTFCRTLNFENWATSKHFTGTFSKLEHFIYSKTQTLIIAKIIVKITINTSLHI